MMKRSSYGADGTQLVTSFTPGCIWKKREQFSTKLFLSSTGLPTELPDEDVEQAAEDAAHFISEERARSRPVPATAAATSQSYSDPAGINTFALTAEDVAALRKSFPILKDFSDNFIRGTPRGDLMKLQSTSFKMKEAEKGKDADDKLASNKSALASRFTTVPAGRDNRWNHLHSARFLGGAACSAPKLWLAAKACIDESGHPALGSYDMGAVGMAGHVSPRGWQEIHNPQSSRISIRQFSINNCGSRAASKSASSKDEFAEDIIDLGEFQLALRALRVAMQFSAPWNFSIVALEGFFLQSNYCQKDLAAVDKKAQMLTQFTDYVLVQNSERWRDSEPFLTTGELRTAWGAFFLSRPQAAVAEKSEKQKRPDKGKPKSRPDICYAFNMGSCPKSATTCFGPKGNQLKHICNHMADRSKPSDVCGKDHPRRGNH